MEAASSMGGVSNEGEGGNWGGGDALDAIENRRLYRGGLHIRGKFFEGGGWKKKSG